MIHTYQWYTHINDNPAKNRVTRIFLQNIYSARTAGCVCVHVHCVCVCANIRIHHIAVRATVPPYCRACHCTSVQFVSCKSLRSAHRIMMPPRICGAPRIVYMCDTHPKAKSLLQKIMTSRMIQRNPSFNLSIFKYPLHFLSKRIRGEVGGWGRVPFSRNFMKPTPRRKWKLTTGRRFH